MSKVNPKIYPINHSVADTCGRRVLNMSGSLNSYIRTGNSYPRDSFHKNTPETKSEKEDRILKKIGLIGLSAAGILLGLKYAPKLASKALNSIKTKLSSIKLPSLPKLFKK